MWETVGELTAGTAVFDRRSPRQGSVNAEVAVDVNAAGLLDVLLTGLERAAGGVTARASRWLLLRGRRLQKTHRNRRRSTAASNIWPFCGRR